MIQEKIASGDLLYHAVHGLCRMDRMIKQSQSGKTVLCYSLVPKITNKMKMRFIIGAEDIQISGFHELVTLKEANRILEYLKMGDQNGHSAGKNETWSLAQTILVIAQEKAQGKDQRKRQTLDRSVRGLLGELAFVFKITLKETAARIQKSLGSVSKINPLVIAALANAVED
jgi:RNA polymerase-interacting CarD/CdnL/TRCF family regulator